MFASKTILEHLFRGAIGLGAFASAVALTPTHPWLSLAMVPLALVTLRGCPLCWTMGLVQTVLAKVQGKSTEGLCVDGSCSIDRRSK